MEPVALHGVLTTASHAYPDIQRFDEESRRYTGRYPTIRGRWVGIYENLAAAIQKKVKLEVEAVQSRDVLRIIELARESHETGRTVPWS